MCWVSSFGSVRGYDTWTFTFLFLETNSRHICVNLTKTIFLNFNIPKSKQTRRTKLVTALWGWLQSINFTSELSTSQNLNVPNLKHLIFQIETQLQNQTRHFFQMSTSRCCLLLREVQSTVLYCFTLGKTRINLRLELN